MLQGLATKTVAEMTAIEMLGLMMIALGLFYIFGIVVRIYDHTWSLPIRAYYWIGCFFGFGVPVIVALRALA